MADDNGPRVTITGLVLAALTSIFVALRFYCKLSRKRKPWWDDLVLTMALMCLIATVAIYIVAVSHGYGKRTLNLDFTQIGALSTLHQAGGIVSLAGAMFSKTSFALTLVRLSGHWLKMLLWFIIISMNLSTIGNLIIILLQCVPLQKAFDPFLEGRCWDTRVIIDYGTYSAAYSGVMDFVLAIIPWTIVWKSQMPMAEKVGIAVAMSMGIVASVVGIIKAVSIAHEDLFQAFYDGNALVTWMVTEIAVTIMAACIPTFRPLIITGVRKYTGSHGVMDHSFRISSRHKRTSGDKYVEIQAGRQHNTTGDEEIGMARMYPEDMKDGHSSDRIHSVEE